MQTSKKTKKQKPEDTNAKSEKLKKQRQVSDEPIPTPPPSPGKIILGNDINPELLAKWPKLKLKIPPIFLHKPVDFERHVNKVLKMGIKFYQPILGKNYTKLTCESSNDHKYMMKYFEKNQLPFHTYGDPSKRKMKVVIRGIPKDTELNKIKGVLKSVSIPVIRVHQMQSKVEKKDGTILVLAVVPYDDEGKAILKVRQILGHEVKMEPPLTKPRQCHRCQKWGHSQRYCQAKMKCVKCAGEHLSKKCEKNSEEPPKCANCSKDHTANYKQCISAPGSLSYQVVQDNKINIGHYYKPVQLVTMENCHTLYKNVDYTSKPYKPFKSCLFRIPSKK